MGDEAEETALKNAAASVYAAGAETVRPLFFFPFSVRARQLTLLEDDFGTFVIPPRSAVIPGSTVARSG